MFMTENREELQNDREELQNASDFGNNAKEKGTLKNEKMEPPIMDELQKTPPLRLLLWFIVFLLGAGFTVGGILIYMYHLDLPGWVAIIDYEGKERELPLEPFLGIIVLVLGMYFLARTIKFNPKKIRENHFYLPHIHKNREPITKSVKTRSFSSSRLIVAILLLLVAVINFIVFGAELTGEKELGAWFSLGGASLFYPTSAIGIAIAVGLIGYVILSTSLMRFSQSDNFYLVEEYRLFVPWMTEIPKNKVKAVRLSNAHTGPKYTWILAFLIPTFWIITDGFHFLLNPFAFGNGIIAGTHYIMSGFISLFCMFILLFKHQTYLEIVTDEKRYELWFSPPLGAPNLIGQIEEIFGIPLMIDELKNQKINTYRENLGNEQNLLTPKSNFRYAWNIVNITIGLIFIAIGVISKILGNVYAGDPMRLILYAYGIYLVVKGIKNDSHRKGMQVMIYNEDENQLFWRNKRGGYNSGFKFKDITRDEFDISARIPKLTFFDIVFSITLVFLVGMDLAGIYYFVPDTEYVSSMKLAHLLLGILLVVLVLWALIHPQNAVSINSKGLKFEYTLPNINVEPEKKGFKAVLRNQLGAFSLRIGLILIFGLLGVLYIAIYLSYEPMLIASGVAIGIIALITLIVQFKK